MSDMYEKIFKEGADKRREEKRKSDLEKEFNEFEFGKLRNMTDKELAIWQSKYLNDSPQYVAAGKEWERRAWKRDFLTKGIVAWLALVIASASLIWQIWNSLKGIRL